MAINNNIIRKIGRFQVEQRCTDGKFNATSLLNQWNMVSDEKKELDKFISGEKEFSKFFIGKDWNAEPEIDGNIWIGNAHFRNFVYFLDPELSFIELPAGLMHESILDKMLKDFAATSTLCKDKPFCKYFTYIATDASGLYKIGRAFNVKKRESTLRIGNNSFSVILVICGDVEKELHANYSRKRVRGEWFSLSSYDIKTIKNKYQAIPRNEFGLA